MPFEYLGDEVVFDGKYIQTIIRSIRARDGSRVTWEMVRRKTYGRIVVVLPVTSQQEVILLKIYRVPPRAYILEACAGLMDRAGESEEDAARREMLEETGYISQKLVPLMAGPFNSGLVEDEIVYFLAPDAQKVQEPVLENAEDIELIILPLSGLFSYLQNPPGNMKADIKLFSVLYFLEKMYLQ